MLVPATRIVTRGQGCAITLDVGELEATLFEALYREGCCTAHGPHRICAAGRSAVGRPLAFSDRGRALVRR